MMSAPGTVPELPAAGVTGSGRLLAIDAAVAHNGPYQWNFIE